MKVSDDRFTVKIASEEFSAPLIRFILFLAPG